MKQKGLAKYNSASGFAPIIILLTILVIGGIVGGIVYFKGKTNQLKSTEPQISLTPSISQTNETSNWKTFPGQGFNFKYPPLWHSDSEIPNNQLGRLSSGYLTTSRPTNKTSITGPFAGFAQVYYQISTDSAENMINSAKGVEKKEQININGHPATRLIGQTDANGTVYFNTVILSQNEKTFIMDLSTHDPELVKPLLIELDQILSTFRFTDQAILSPTLSQQSLAKQLTYALPSGWKTAKDKGGTIEIGYNPQTNEPSIDYSPNGIAATGKWGSNPTRKLAGNFTAGIGSYDGGSKHTNLFKGLSAEELKTGNWKAPDYFEKEYTYNNWPCLVIFGFYVSQWPVTQGMCVISNSKAVYFSADTKNPGEAETFMQSIKIL